MTHKIKFGGNPKNPQKNYPKRKIQAWCSVYDLMVCAIREEPPPGRAGKGGGESAAGSLFQTTGKRGFAQSRGKLRKKHIEKPPICKANGVVRS